MRLFLAICIIILPVAGFAGIKIDNPSGGGGGGATNSMLCDINGAWAYYAGSNSVTITNGMGYCNGNYFHILAPTSYVLTSLATTQTVSYIYIDDSESTYPSNLSYTDSTNPPAYNGTLGGWYNGNDRVLDWCITSNLSASILRYCNFADGSKLFPTKDQVLSMAANHAPSGGWDTPNRVAGRPFFPCNIKEGLFTFWGNDPNTQNRMAVLNKEAADLMSGITIDLIADLGFGYIGWNQGGMAGVWCPIGQSLEIRLYGEDGDEDQLRLEFMGARISR